MGTVIEINENIVTVKFEDGSLKKYLKENFIREPFLNQNVLLNKNGTLIDLKEKRKIEKIKLIILLCGVILLIIIFYCALYKVINNAMNFGNEINSCISMYDY